MGIDFWKLVLGWEPKIEAGKPYVETDSEDNVIEGLDFARLAEEEEDETKALAHEYFGSVGPTEKMKDRYL